MTFDSTVPLKAISHTDTHTLPQKKTGQKVMLQQSKSISLSFSKFFLFSFKTKLILFQTSTYNLPCIYPLNTPRRDSKKKKVS